MTTLSQRSVIFPSSRLYLMASRTPSRRQIRPRLPRLTHAREVYPVARYLSCPACPSSVIRLSTVASLLNPCQCDDVCNCGCRANSEFASESRALSPHGNNGASGHTPSDGLETLAYAAAAILFSSSQTPPTSAINSTQINSSSGADGHASPGPSRRSSETATPSSPTSTPTPVLDLPPLLFPEFPGPTPVVPPFSTFNTLAGSGCTCGLTCQCPDCASHRPRSDVDPRNIQDCMSCVDQTLRVIDRSGGGFHVQSPVLEKFFAHAERVPLPPTRGGKPVELPKLCCGGSCGCGGVCGCGGDCNGQCQHIERNTPHKDARNNSISLAVEPPPTESRCCQPSI
jgi:hypothetical protein